MPIAYQVQTRFKMVAQIILMIGFGREDDKYKNCILMWHK